MVLSMDRWKGKTAIVTGAGGGLGQAVVKKLLAEGIQVIGVDVDAKNLEELSSTVDKEESLHAFVADVTKDEEVVKLFEDIKEKLGPVHILVNCAGIFQLGDLTADDTAKWRKTLEVNVLGLCIMTKEVVKSMKENKIDGHIIHIGSVAAHRVPPNRGVNVYPASKWAVKALTETLRQELNRQNLKIKVSCVCPGQIKTPLLEAAVGSIGIERMASSLKLLEPSDVADGILYILSTPPHVQVHDLFVKAIGDA